MSTHRFFKVTPAVYTGLRAAVDAERGYPWTLTLTGLPSVENLHVAPDGKALIAIDKWRFKPADTTLMAPYIASGDIVELTEEEYRALLPTPSLDV